MDVRMAILARGLLRSMRASLAVRSETGGRHLRHVDAAEPLLAKNCLQARGRVAVARLRRDPG
jgi:hypothetical protein